MYKYSMTENLCSNKIECNLQVKIKVDPDTKMWYVKSVKMAHDDESF